MRRVGLPVLLTVGLIVGCSTDKPTDPDAPPQFYYWEAWEEWGNDYHQWCDGWDPDCDLRPPDQHEQMDLLLAQDILTLKDWEDPVCAQAREILAGHMPGIEVWDASTGAWADYHDEYGLGYEHQAIHVHRSLLAQNHTYIAEILLHEALHEMGYLNAEDLGLPEDDPRTAEGKAKQCMENG